MPILDKLTTIINWKVDDGELDSYESQLNQVEAAQDEVASGSKQAASSIGAFSIEIDSTSEFLDELGKKTNMNVKNVTRLGDAAEQAGDGMDSLGDKASDAGNGVGDFASKASRAAREATDIERSVNEAGRGFQDFGSEVTETVSDLVKFGSIATGIVTTLGIMSSKELTKNIRLAETVGMTQDAYLGWEGVLKNIGFEGEKSIDLMEEMNNKLGELNKLGKMSSAQDALKMLGIGFKEIKELAPEDQFMKIMEAAKSLGDEQVAASAVDMIMGGDANRIVGLLRTYDGSVKDIIQTHRDMNFVTTEGIAGSMALTNSWNNLETAGTSLFTEVTGRAGEHLAPMINGLLDWASANKELIDQNIEGIVDGVTESFRWLAWAGEKAADAVESIGGLGNAFKFLVTGVAAWKTAGLVTSLSGAITAFGVATKGAGLFGTALKLLGKTPLIALFTGAALALEDLYVFMNGGKSFFGEWTEKLIPDVEDAFLSLFGVIRDDMSLEEKQLAIAEWRQSFLDAVYSIEDGYDTVVDATTDAIDWSVKAWDRYAPAAKAAGSAIFGFYQDGYSFLGGLVTGWYSTVTEGGASVLNFFTGWYDEMINVFEEYIDSLFGPIESFVDKVSGAIEDIPFIGSIFEDGEANVPTGKFSAFGDREANVPTGKLSATMDSAVASLPMASVGTPVVTGGGKGDYNDNSRTEVNAPITIHQASGQSPHEVAKEVTDQLQQQFANVKKTGIKR